MNSKALRETIESIRRKPYPLADLIPRLLKAADELDRLTTGGDRTPHMDRACGLADGRVIDGFTPLEVKNDQ